MTSAEVAGTAFPSRAPIVVAALWLLMAVSAIVNVEPAPFDLLAVALCVLFAFLGLKVPSRLFAPVLFLAILLLANAISIVVAASKEALPVFDMLFYAGLTAYLAVVWLVMTSIVAADARYVLRVLWSGWSLAAIATVSLGLVAYLQLVPGYEAFLMSGRAKATFKDANVYAPYLIPVALYQLTRLRANKPVINVLHLLIFLYVLVGILIGFSRGAWGNFILSFSLFAVLMLFNARTLQTFMRLFLAGSAVTVVAIGVFFATISTPQFGDMFKIRASLLQQYDVEAGGRFSTQKAALSEINRNPIGIGPDQSSAALGRSPHNVYLKIAVENGWIGGIAFVAFIGITLWNGFFFALRPGPLQREFAVAYASTFGIVAESFIIDSLHWRHFFVVLAMVWGIMIAAQRQPAYVNA